jgi:hypothetical protein
MLCLAERLWLFMAAEYPTMFLLTLASFFYFIWLDIEVNIKVAMVSTSQVMAYNLARLESYHVTRLCSKNRFLTLATKEEVIYRDKHTNLLICQFNCETKWFYETIAYFLIELYNFKFSYLFQCARCQCCNLFFFVPDVQVFHACLLFESNG